MLSAYTQPARTWCSILFARILIWQVSSRGTGTGTLGRGGKEAHLYIVDSDPNFIKAPLEHSIGSNEQFETIAICTIFNIIATHKATTANASKLAQEITPLKN
jgi:hypothetical protein